MMANVIIVHGAYGYPEENWFPYLKSELEKLGCRVFVPKFPTPEGQDLDNWLKVFDDYKGYLDEDTVVVGHSTGVPFLLNVLERSKRPVRAAFFVSGFTGLLDDPRFDSIIRTISDRDFDWRIIRENCREFFVLHSDNDPYVPIEKARRLAKSLGSELIIVRNAGHFNTKAGYQRFPLLLEKVRDIL